MNIDPETMKKIDQARAEGRVMESVAKKILSPEEALADESLDEKAFMADVVKLAKRYGWNFIYHTLNSRGSAAGFPDLCMVRERCLFAELKSKKGKLEPAQREWIDALRAAGIEVHLWRPSDWKMIEEALR